MFKAMILLKRKEEYTQREFRNWWLGEHAQLAIQLPGLRKLCFNPTDNEEAMYDGVAELWFDSEADFTEAYQTELGKAVAADSLAHVGRRDRLFVDENILLDDQNFANNFFQSYANSNSLNLICCFNYFTMTCYVQY